MEIGIIDAELIGRKKHRFPNLACEKISGYWKEKGANVHLLLNYDTILDFDEVFISKVFTDTWVPEGLKETNCIHLGGTGFFFDKAPNLDPIIEHHFPDYSLYDDWVNSELSITEAHFKETRTKFNYAYYRNQYKEYLDYSIGFITRGCFRKCGFCVNKKYDHVFQNSPLEEFYDPNRKKICLLDDNFLGYPKWRDSLDRLLETNKPFKFKQGLDERLLNDEKCEILFNSKYDGDFTFAFDNISDYDLIFRKLKIIRNHTDRTNIKFYVLVGFDSTDSQDIENAFKRVQLLMQFKCLPYIMRYQDNNETPWKDSEMRGMYTTLARWANQPSIFKKMSFRQFCEANQELHKSDGLCSSMKAMSDFEKQHPEIAKKYFDLRFEDFTL